MTIKLSSRLRIRPCVTPQDITTPRMGSWVDVTGAQEVLTTVTTGSVAAGSTVTLQAMQALDAAGTGAKALGAPVVSTAPAGGSPIAIQADTAIVDLDDQNGFGFVTVQLSSNNGSAVQAAATLVLGNNRYNP